MDTSYLDDHSRTIIHIDLDCFYAQVEMNKNPKLRALPLGIQQKNIVVTSNYIARQFGVKKCMLLSEAKKLCPTLTLVNGEDLHDYRQTSYKVTTLMQKFSTSVERLGLDENFVDITELVEKRLGEISEEFEVIGHVFGGDDGEKCECGCSKRLAIGTIIAQEIRNELKRELNLTSCAGVAHNKLLAKMVGSQHKPDQQSVVFPNSAFELMLSLGSATNIPGIGRAMGEQLEGIGVTTVQDLQDVGLKHLEQLVGGDKAKLIHNLSYGIDPSSVKASGRPQSIGIEDSCKSISARGEVEEKLLQLLERLLVLVDEDGRIPKTIKLTLRKFDKSKIATQRETRQCNILTSLFTSKPVNSPKILAIIMHLFNRIIDTNKPYHITLLGLSFTKFQTPPNSRNSIATFLRKNIEVQSVTSIENQVENVSPIPSTSTLTSGSSEADSPSPSPKKIKLQNLVTKKRCYEDFEDSASPSKLRVADLCLGSKDASEMDVFCPPNADKDVFVALPREIQKELWDDYKRLRESERNFCSSQVKKAKPNTLLNYFIKN